MLGFDQAIGMRGSFQDEFLRDADSGAFIQCFEGCLFQRVAHYPAVILAPPAAVSRRQTVSVPDHPSQPRRASRYSTLLTDLER
jgi:hypothetical protein